MPLRADREGEGGWKEATAAIMRCSGLLPSEYIPGNIFLQMA